MARVVKIVMIVDLHKNQNHLIVWCHNEYGGLEALLLSMDKIALCPFHPNYIALCLPSQTNLGNAPLLRKSS